ncbi:MAG TPA: 50S ribosomal protein L9, partial [Solibacterales bacterium]|nr:50S ribosomal protein L9 [Bryobacterales bacterium]
MRPLITNGGGVIEKEERWGVRKLAYRVQKRDEGFYILVILRDDVEKLGHRGQIVKVAPGYARNFLLPKKLAVPATGANKKIVEQERQAHLRKEAKLEGDASELAKMLNGHRAEDRRAGSTVRFGHREGCRGSDQGRVIR